MNFLCNMNQSFANETQIDKFRLNCLGLFIWDELVRLGGMARLGEVIFISRSYGIFYLTAKSLLRHCKKIVLITWLFSRNFYIFNMDSRRLQQFHFTVYSIINMINAFSYFFATSWDFTYIVNQSEKRTASNFKWNIVW